MGNFMDLAGIRFGKLTVLYRAEDHIQPSGQHKRVWHCKCDCGNECNVRANDLKSGNTTSCGCVQQESRGKSQLQDFTGQRFGKLVVLYRIPNHITPSGQQQRMWRCRCDCGKIIDVYAAQIKRGLTSCGCIKEEARKQKKQEFEMLQKQKRMQRLSLIAEKKEQKRQETVAMRQAEGEHRQHLLEENRQQRKCELEKIRQKKKEESERIQEQRLIEESLTARFPEIAKEWDRIKNGDLLPSDVFATSSKKVWWICPQGHSYFAAIANRTGPGKNGCPYCSVPAKRVLKGFNDLQSKYPLIAEIWHPNKNLPLHPDEVLCGSGKRVWWLGKCGHVFDQSINNMVKGAGCPYCSHQKLLPGYNDFASTNPELLSEWDYEKNDVQPDEIMPNSHYKAWWKCPFGHSYQAWMSSRCGKTHTGCSVCDKENHTSFPEQALFYYIKQLFQDACNSDREAIGIELDIYIPSQKTAIEYDGFIWHKNNAYELKKNSQCKQHGIRLIRIREDGLPNFQDCECIIRKDLRSSSGLNKAILDALSILGGSSIDVDVDRDSAFIYSSYITTRKTQSLMAKEPLIAKEWHPEKNGYLTPEMVYPLSSKKVWWLGACGHEWYMSIQNRVLQRCNCPICSGKRIVSGINDLLSNYPDLCNEWNYELNNKAGIFPDHVAPHSDRKAWWSCKRCGHTWYAKIDGRTRMQAGCPECGKAVISRSKFKPVLCVETGAVYESLQEAESQTGISRTCIGNCCRGTQKSAGKLHWKYAEVSTEMNTPGA